MLIKVVKSVNFKEAYIANRFMNLTETFVVKLSQIADPDVSSKKLRSQLVFSWLN